MLPSFPLAVRPVGDPSTSCPPPRPPSPLNSTAELLVMSGNHVRPPFAHPAMVTDGLGTHSPRCWTPELLAPACQVSDTQVSDAARNMSERAITGRCSQHTRVGGGRGAGLSGAEDPLHCLPQAAPFPANGARGPTPHLPRPHTVVFWGFDGSRPDGRGVSLGFHSPFPMVGEAGHLPTGVLAFRVSSISALHPLFRVGLLLTFGSRCVLGVNPPDTRLANILSRSVGCRLTLATVPFSGYFFSTSSCQAF